MTPGELISALGGFVTLSGGVLLWVRYRREVKEQEAAAVAKKKADEDATSAKVAELDISRAELIEQIGNSLFTEMRTELTRSNEAREEQRLELAAQWREIKELRTQVQNLHESDRRHRHNEHEMIRHIDILEQGYPYPPGPPARPKWDLLTPSPQGPATA